MKIYHTETQADYDALMVELEEQGCTWLSGRKPTSPDYWKQYGEKTGIEVGESGLLSKGVIEYLEEVNPQAEVIKYKAKADEKMKFTKENIEGLVNKYFDDNVGECPGNLIAEIYAMDDTPEKVVIPKFVADFYEKRKYCILSVIFDEFKKSEERKVADWYRDGQSGGRHVNEIANSQETIAKMHLYGYTIEPEKLYYIPLPSLETSDGIQQVLSKRDTYFASRPNEKLKQRYTKEELEQVPEIYKPYAKPIEEEEE